MVVIETPTTVPTNMIATKLRATFRLEHFHPDWNLSLRGAQRRGNPLPDERRFVRRGIAASLRSSQ
jgi:hypothetical protein